MEYLLGQIFQFSFAGGTEYWVECAGQELQIAQNQALFSLIGNKFGGNGTTTFCLPDMRNASLFPGNMKYYIALSGIYPSRS
jgi:microcystin-dependent protein